MSNASRASKNERRDAAREKAREERVRQQRRERRNRVVLQAAIGVVIVAIVAIVAVVIVNSVRPPGPGPRNMANGGISIQGADLEAVTTKAAAADATPVPGGSTVSGGHVLIQAYEDFGCPACQNFEQTYGAQAKSLVTSGAAVVQYHPVAILDRNFTDGNYSTGAANAAAAVANWSRTRSRPSTSCCTARPSSRRRAPRSHRRPPDRAREAGEGHQRPPDLEAIRDQQFKNWVGARTDEFIDKTGLALRGEDPANNRGSTPRSSSWQYWNGTTTSAPSSPASAVRPRHAQPERQRDAEPQPDRLTSQDERGPSRIREGPLFVCGRMLG